MDLARFFNQRKSRNMYLKINKGADEVYFKMYFIQIKVNKSSEISDIKIKIIQPNIQRHWFRGNE